MCSHIVGGGKYPTTPQQHCLSIPTTSINHQCNCMGNHILVWQCIQAWRAKLLNCCRVIFLFNFLMSTRISTGAIPRGHTVHRAQSCVYCEHGGKPCKTWHQVWGVTQCRISTSNIWRSFEIRKQPFCGPLEVCYTLRRQNGMDVGDQN
jgi:hypothetical protein